MTTTVSPSVFDLTDPGYAHFLGAGWSGTEWAWTWTLDDESLMILPTPRQDVDCRLLVRATPYLPKGCQKQTLSAYCNGWHFGTEYAQHLGFRLYSFDLSRHAFTNRPAISITLRHGDALAPSQVEGGTDERRLAFGVSEIRLQALTAEYLQQIEALKAAISAPLAHSEDLPAFRPPPDAELVSHFESLGTNCEFGFVQRLAGSEPLGLLRLAGLPVDKLLRGLEDGFGSIAAPGRHFVDIDPKHPDEGLIGRDANYTMYYHTYLQPETVSAEALLITEEERLPYLARKLMEDIDDGEKILVVKDDTGFHLDDVLRIEAAVRSRGDALILWVEGAEPGHDPGTVEVLRPGLMKGRVDRFAELKKGLKDVSQTMWLQMLRNAWALRSRARVGA